MAQDDPGNLKALPIVYVRGYAGTQSDVEETVDDPFYGFNLGSTHIRIDDQGKADYFIFESPFVRLLTDHGYTDVFDSARQAVDADAATPHRTIWIYRYYDPTSKTYDRPGGRRLSIEEAAAGLREMIGDIRQSTGAPKVLLIAHSMGGMVCRSAIQKIYPDAGEHAGDAIDKFLTFGTPHGGIHFDIAGAALESLRDRFGVNNSDVFGRARMYEYLTPAAQRQSQVPDAFDPLVIPPDAFDVDRVFCIVGTNAHDYDVANGASRTAVGPQSDGLVQIESASVKDAARAYIHRSHSGRYGMVNSAEGFQNLERFLFGDVRVHTGLCDLDLQFPPADGKTDVTYQLELRVSIRGLPVPMHERSKAEYSAVSLSRAQFEEQRQKGGLPLFDVFLIHRFGRGDTMRYALRLGLYQETFRKGFLMLPDHMELLPVWSDYLIVDLTPGTDASVSYTARYAWASDSLEPQWDVDLTPFDAAGKTQAFIPLPDRGRQVVGQKARLRFEARLW